MSALSTCGSPAIDGSSSCQFQVHDEGQAKQDSSPSTRQPIFVDLASLYSQNRTNHTYQSTKHSINPSGDGPIPLSSSKLGNIQVRPDDRIGSGYKVCQPKSYISRDRR